MARPEVRYSQGDEKKAWASFSIASDRGYHKEGEQSADFIECKVFIPQLVDVCDKYLDRGRKIVVYGVFRNDNYVGQDGRKVYKDVLIVDKIEFADSKPAGTEQSTAQQGVQQNAQAPAKQVQNAAQAQAPSPQAAKNRAVKPAPAQAQAPQPQPAPQQAAAPVQQGGEFLDFSSFSDVSFLN